jgi:hypothetical protein
MLVILHHGPPKVLWLAFSGFGPHSIETRCLGAVYSIATIRSSGATLIDSVWDFKCKFRNGFFEKVFVRICGKGCHPKKGIFASFSPTASQISIRLAYAITALA